MRAWFQIIAFIVCTTADYSLAGDWSPNTNVVYTLALSDTNRTYALTEPDLRWQAKLQNRLKIDEWKRTKGHTVMTFALTQHKCYTGTNLAARVYADINNPDILLVRCLETESSFIVKLEEKTVGAEGLNARGYIHPDLNFITVFWQQPTINGVPVRESIKDPHTGDYKSIMPLFKEKTVVWW